MTEQAAVFSCFWLGGFCTALSMCLAFECVQQSYAGVCHHNITQKFFRSAMLQKSQLCCAVLWHAVCRSRNASTAWQ
jgi:hypothetical protein